MEEKTKPQARTRDLGKGSIPKLLAQLAIPVVVAQIVNLLYNIVDRIYIGHIPDQLIIYGTQEIDKSVFSAGTLDTADNLVALFPFSYKYRNHIHRILKIAAHDNGTIS